MKPGQFFYLWFFAVATGLAYQGDIIDKDATVFGVMMFAFGAIETIVTAIREQK